MYLHRDDALAREEDAPFRDRGQSVGVAIGKEHALRGELIEIGGFNPIVAVTAQMVRPEGVGDDDIKLGFIPSSFEAGRYHIFCSGKGVRKS